MGEAEKQCLGQNISALAHAPGKVAKMQKCDASLADVVSSATRMEMTKFNLADDNLAAATGVDMAEEAKNEYTTMAFNPLLAQVDNLQASSDTLEAHMQELG